MSEAVTQTPSIRKPDTRIAMQTLIEQMRVALPFEMPVDDLCSGVCQGCSKKLLDYLDMQLIEWEGALERGEKPALGDLDKLAGTGRKIEKVLARNGLV